MVASLVSRKSVKRYFETDKEFEALKSPCRSSQRGGVGFFAVQRAMLIDIDSANAAERHVEGNAHDKIRRKRPHGATAVEWNSV
ncbi:hypothetical protein WN55_09253 [Dufourea novaeangliae]|uniref:Uncharacterized protein n=1 Tax=Dufourea novaeangliae TaxID=178035 RepID=A0A154P8W6_DUFNO|nr:hypothetical protein WN55_09253 [Dufourea novaeangliae]